MWSARALILAALAATPAHAKEVAQQIDIHFTSRTTVVDGKAMKAAAKARRDEGAEIEADYASAPPQKLADSARDLAKAAPTRSQGLFRVVDRPELAHLVVEVTGRHSSKSDFDKLLDDQFGFILRVSPGGKLAAGRLRRAAVRWPEDEEQDVVIVNELQGFSEDEPYWLLQCLGGSSWKDLANHADAILADFALVNASLIVGRAPK